MEQAEGIRDMGGEVVFRRDGTSNLTKAVSGTEWMYRKGALEKSKKVSACVCVCVNMWVWVGAVTIQCILINSGTAGEIDT